MSNGKKDGHTRQYLRTIFDVNPLPTFVVDADVRIHDYNTAGAHLLGTEPKLALHRRGGDALHCINADAKGCGQGEHCQDCVIRSGVKQALDGGRVNRRIHKAELRRQDKPVVIDLLVTATPLPGGETPQVLLILENFSELLTLLGLIPICAQCKKVRDDQQSWHSIEFYLQRHMNLKLTHGLCPTCYAERMKALEGGI